ncbi:unnamed protein product [Brassica oleracea var. botrytis]
MSNIVALLVRFSPILENIRVLLCVTLCMPCLSGGNEKQFSSQQQNPLLQQQSSAISPQGSLGIQAPGFNVMSSGLLAAAIKCHDSTIGSAALCYRLKKNHRLGHHSESSTLGFRDIKSQRLQPMSMNKEPMFTLISKPPKTRVKKEDGKI